MNTVEPVETMTDMLGATIVLGDLVVYSGKHRLGVLKVGRVERFDGDYAVIRNAKTSKEVWRRPSSVAVVNDG